MEFRIAYAAVMTSRRIHTGPEVGNTSSMMTMARIQRPLRSHSWFLPLLPILTFSMIAPQKIDTIKSMVLPISIAVARAAVGTSSTDVANWFRYMNPIMIDSVSREYEPMVHISFLVAVTCGMVFPPYIFSLQTVLQVTAIRHSYTAQYTKQKCE